MKGYILVLISVSLIIVLSVASGLVTINLNLNVMRFEKIVAIIGFIFIFYVAMPYVLYLENK